MKNIDFAFILGNPRSGTSLFRLMLNANRQIVSPPECGFMQWWYEKYKDWKIEDNNSSRLDFFINDLFKSKKIETWQLQKDRIKEIIISNQPQSYNQLSSCIYLAYGKKNEKVNLLIDKNNYYIHHLDWLKHVRPNAKYIHLIRDGRDVACSYKNIEKLKSKSVYKPNLPQTVDEIAKEWVNNNLLIKQLSDNYDYLLIRYEDLIIDTKTTLKKVCSFLNVEFDSKMESYYEFKEDFLKEPKETLEWKLKTKERPDKSRIGQYKQMLSDTEISIFEKIASKQLNIYGY